MSGYIGTQPVPQATQTRQTFVATAAQTSFATAGYSVGYLDTFLNGVKLQDGVDYTATNGSDIVLTVGAALDDTLEVVAYTAFEVVNAATAAQGALADTAVQPNDSPTLADLTLSGGVYLGGTGAANKLDDYEEGTFTPYYENAGTATYTIQSGRYTKIGQVVHIQCHLDIAALGTASGSINVNGLPFTVQTDYLQYPSTSAPHGNSWGVSRGSLGGLAFSATTRVQFFYNNGSVSVSNVQHSDLATGNLLFSLTYQTDA